LWISGNKEINERTENTMTRLRTLSQSLNVWIGLIVHLRKTPNTNSVPFERGAIPNDDDLKGTGGIKQLSNTIIALQRNNKHSDEYMRNVVGLHVLKNRLSGQTGEVDFLYFNSECGRMQPISKPDKTILEDKLQKRLNDFEAF
jgi:twinkle protein